MAVCPHCETKGETPLVACPSGDGFYFVDEAVYASDSDDPMLGRCIAGRFIVSSILGHGSMGTVYRARQEQVDRDVAIKVFRSEALVQKRLGRSGSMQEREAAQARFVQEARVLGKLSHPNCVTVYDFGTGEGGDFMYMAMEFVAGLSLHQAIHRGLKFDAVVEITRQILRALREAHTLGVVHRDLKPENIVLSYRFHTGEQIVKVLDFGIAKLLQSDAKKLTKAGALFGTPAYMSPEQCRGELGSIGPQVDIYALGCILYEMLCGQLPYSSQIPQQMIRFHLEAPIPPLDLRRGFEAPPGLQEFVHTCLAKDRQQRFADADAAIAAFEEVMGGASGVELTVSESGIRTRPGITRGTRSVVVPRDNLSGDVLDPLGNANGAEAFKSGQSQSVQSQSGPAVQSTPAAQAASAVQAPSTDSPNSAPDRAADPAESSSQVSVPSSPRTRATSKGQKSQANTAEATKRLRFRLMLAVLSLAICGALIAAIVYFWA